MYMYKTPTWLTLCCLNCLNGFGGILAMVGQPLANKCMYCETNFYKRLGCVHMFMYVIKRKKKEKPN